MKKYIYVTVTFLIYSLSAGAQGKIKDGTVIGSPSLPNASSVFELESNNKGFYMPRVSLSNTLTWGLAGAAVSGGMTVYNTNASITGAPTAPIITGGVGVYYWDGSRWVAGTGQQKAQADSTYWGLLGNSGLSSTSTVGTAVGLSNFLGTTDAVNLSFGTSNTTRMVIGQNGNAYGGTSTSGTGTESFSWGQADTATATASSAFGIRNRVAAQGSIVAGRDNKLASTAIFSAVFGDNNRDSGLHTLVSGVNNHLNAIAYGCVVLGSQHRIENTGAATDPVHLAGNLVSGVDNRINVDGINNISGNVATHFNIIAGQSNLNTTSANTAIFGYRNEVEYSDGCFVAGFDNRVHRARAASILGTQNIDSSSHSFVTGQGNIINASMVSSSVVGRFNEPISNSLFTVGNGTSGASRSNALVVSGTSTSGATVNGLIVLIPSLPSYTSDADATADTSLPSGGLYKIGNDIRIKN